MQVAGISYITGDWNTCHFHLQDLNISLDCNQQNWTPCHATKGLECVFPIWFTQCGSVWFTLAMPCSNHAILLKATAQHDRLSTAVLALRRTAWSEHGIANVNQTRPHCVNQMGKTHCKPSAARHGRGTARYVW